MSGVPIKAGARLKAARLHLDAELQKTAKSIFAEIWGSSAKGKARMHGTDYLFITLDGTPESHRAQAERSGWKVKTSEGNRSVLTNKSWPKTHLEIMGNTAPKGRETQAAIYVDA